MKLIKYGKKSVLILSIMFSLCAFIGCNSQPPAFDEDEWLERVKSADPASLYAPHFNEDGVFFNPWLQRSRLSGSDARFLKRLLENKKKYSNFPQEKYSAMPNDYTYLSDPDFDSISFAGHSSLIIKMNRETIFTDPFFSNRALVVGKKVKIKFNYSNVPEKPVVLISHNHYDHLDKKTIKKLVKKNAVFIVPLGLRLFFTNLGAREVYDLDWWQSVTLGTVTYTLLPSQHWSRRIGQKSSTTLWGGFLIEGTKTVYYSGDSGYFIGFEEFGRRYEIDYAIVQAGAYEPRWFMHYSHLNVEEFFRAADELDARITIPTHLGVIKLGDEHVLYPLYEIDQYIELNSEYSQQVRPLRVGEFLRME
jgi:L-ascorbate metabolism protein UlaG (beta-lactamase superfamily)